MEKHQWRSCGQTVRGTMAQREAPHPGPCTHQPEGNLRMRLWKMVYRESSTGIEYFPLTMRSFAPSSKGCCRKHSRYRMQPRACRESRAEAGQARGPGH